MIGSEGRWYPKRENGMAAFGLRLEWIGIECRRVVFDLQFVQPIEIVQHETGAKPACSPLSEVAINFLRVAVEAFSRCKQPAIMSEVVNSYLEPISC